MVLTEQKIEHYFREGYVIVPGLIPAQRLAPIQAVARTLVDDEARFQAHIFDRDNPENNDMVTHALFLDQAVIEAVEQIFNGPARAFYGFLAIVPPHRGKGLPWHQDNQYNQFHGLALNTFIAIDDVEQDMAHLWVAPGSHKQGTLPSIDADKQTGTHHRTIDFEPADAICLPPFKAGDAVIFDRNTLHRSLGNTTDRPRLCYASQFVAEHARHTKDGKRFVPSYPAQELREKLMA